MLAMAGITALAITSCSKSSGSSAPPLIGGYVSSDSVASSALVAYWPLDGNGNDIKGVQSGTAHGSVSYITGIRGQAYQGDTTGTYISCNPNSSLVGLTSYTVSVWVKNPVAAKKPGNGTAHTSAEGIFFMSDGHNANNEFIIESDNASANQLATDSMAIHWGFDDPGSTGWQGFTMNSWGTDTATSGWEHLVMTYDGTSSNYIAYWNANPVGVSSAWSSGNYVTPTQILNGPTGTGTPLGNINFSSATPVAITIGAWPPASIGGLYGLNEANSFAGSIDELRVYNRALTQQEITGLYLNGRAGR